MLFYVLKSLFLDTSMQLDVDNAVKKLNDSMYGRVFEDSRLLDRVSFIFDAHSDFLQIYTKKDVDFIFDKKSGLYFVDCRLKHVELNAALYRFHVKDVKDDYEASDAYILEGYGMFKSRAGNFIYKSSNFVVSSELKSIYRDLRNLDDVSQHSEPTF